MREPSVKLVIDAAILIGLVRGGRTASAQAIARDRQVFTTSTAVHEARSRILFGMKRPDLVESLERFVALIEVIPSETLLGQLGDARSALKDAVPSRNGSTSDDHVLALAWSANADIWSPDRDFAGTGVASWSTPNLVRALTMA